MGTEVLKVRLRESMEGSLRNQMPITWINIFKKWSSILGGMKWVEKKAGAWKYSQMADFSARETEKNIWWEINGKMWWWKQILIPLLNPIKNRSRENKHPWFKGWRRTKSQLEKKEKVENTEDEVIGGSIFLMLWGGRDPWPHNSPLHPQGQVRWH